MDRLHGVLSNIANLSKSTEEVDQGFSQAAKIMLADYRLVAGTTHFQILELEFYFHQALFHPDPYSHAFQYPNRVQAKMSVTGSWYFHRFIGIEKYTHTRRGLDLTYGNGKKQAYGGILFRSALREHDRQIFSGPSNLMKAVLEAASDPQGVQHLAFNLEEGMAFRPDSVIRMEPREKSLQPDLFKTSRFGLGDKDPFYRDKEYRFFSDSRAIKKVKDFRYRPIFTP